jgi:hypothetical protein
MRLDEYQIANALIDTRLVMTSRLVERFASDCGRISDNLEGRNMMRRS